MTLNLADGRWQGLGSWVIRGKNSVILPVDFTNPYVAVKAESRSPKSSRWVKAGEVYQVIPFAGLQEGQFNRLFLSFNQSTIFEFSDVSLYQVKLKPVDWHIASLITAWRWIPNPSQPIPIIPTIPPSTEPLGNQTIFNAGIPL